MLLDRINLNNWGGFSPPSPPLVYTLVFAGGLALQKCWFNHRVVTPVADKLERQWL